jgi:hypothetical protein
LEPFEEMIDRKECDFEQDNTISHRAQMFVQATGYAAAENYDCHTVLHMNVCFIFVWKPETRFIKKYMHFWTLQTSKYASFFLKSWKMNLNECTAEYIR